mmetsp:Transcript_15521/g.44019  ORF Transcript_15521/g.44019 Transcript_15521/m.44019 type:complete len:200 (-) Transcript_15521:295-894(-)|eukprot:CAMPEP_0119136152 /NCGR_PEP_ID=MMETSP1310-20130426/20823_1 /TAXON_ID=464262 /ORGANISM="Genus nov. species nov., Strain RCC2339" /LENGTH=199 /DNA_ID=CAMNT_0007127119 /DNA_START=42 /DNA_END=641 /DNA_ORIENTATION=+
MKEGMAGAAMTMSSEVIMGKKVTVITFTLGKRWYKYFIGVQVARLLKRQTFNMYRSMKSKRIRVIRASPDQIKHLLKVGVVPRNTHSVTLVPYKEALEFMADHWKREPPIPLAKAVPGKPLDATQYVGYLEATASISLLLLSYAGAKGQGKRSSMQSMSMCKKAGVPELPSLPTPQQLDLTVPAPAAHMSGYAVSSRVY